MRLLGKFYFFTTIRFHKHKKAAKALKVQKQNQAKAQKHLSGKKSLQ